MKKLAFDEWIQQRLNDMPDCWVEAAMRCIPLRGDPICRTCYEHDVEERIPMEKESDDGKQV